MRSGYERNKNRASSVYRCRNKRSKFLCFVVMALGSLSLFLLLHHSEDNIVEAATSSLPTMEKYYCSIQVQEGDTLWEIAQTYGDLDQQSVKEYIQEVSIMNHLDSEEIHASGYLMIPYYKAEQL